MEIEKSSETEKEVVTCIVEQIQEKESEEESKIIEMEVDQQSK